MSAEPPKSPAVDHFEWARISVALYGDFEDAKLWPGGSARYNELAATQPVGALIHSTC